MGDCLRCGASPVLRAPRGVLRDPHDHRDGSGVARGVVISCFARVSYYSPERKGPDNRGEAPERWLRQRLGVCSRWLLPRWRELLLRGGARAGAQWCSAAARGRERDGHGPLVERRRGACPSTEGSGSRRARTLRQHASFYGAVRAVRPVRAMGGERRLRGASPCVRAGMSRVSNRDLCVRWAASDVCVVRVSVQRAHL